MPRSRSRPDLRAAETKNVHWLFDSHPRIRRFIDIHSFGGTILHPWGDDTTQTTDPCGSTARATAVGW
jgi:murein tripeptide amidase MpaA